jgi:putative nucleotidyltransferase with HDIG domain
MSLPNPTSSPQIPAVTTRSERVAQRAAAKGTMAKVIAFLKSKHQGQFLLLMFLTSIAIGCVISAWNEPFCFRLNTAVDRAIICNASFAVPSEERKRLAIERARWDAPHVFVNDPEPLIQLRESLCNTIPEFLRKKTYNELDKKEQEKWHEFLLPPRQAKSPVSDNAPAAAFALFTSYFKDAASIEHFRTKLKNVFAPYESRGILMTIPFGPDTGSQDRVLIYQKGGSPDQAVAVKTEEVLIQDGLPLREALRQELKNAALGDMCFNWLYRNLKDGTLTSDPTATAKSEQDAADKVPDMFIQYVPGQLLINAGTVLKQNDIALLYAEYLAHLKSTTKTKKTLRFAAGCSVLFLVLVIIVAFISRLERRRPTTPKAFFYLMLGLIATVAAAQCTHHFALTYADWEILPLLIFAMFVSIVYSWELATIFSILLAIVIVCGNGGDIYLFMILLGTTIAASIQLGRLRSRKKLVIVGTVAGMTAFLLTLSSGIQGDRVIGAPLYIDAAINFVWALLAGIVMTAVLPFIEKTLDILTDMNLLELGDVSHPLIRELIKSAPATYGHSVQVGVIAEAAADVVDARGLLTRVGAYFHDIGKIMNPGYFSENQDGVPNIHDRVEPQISTIAVIAHVKDGVELAKQHHLPKPLIDLIEQHHGTSLVSFFYGKASKESVTAEESTFRYPGPKPKTKEAAILMIADTCESACRSMGAGVPQNKIENKIRTLIKQKLDDGQFDDSGLTLNELKQVEISVTRSVVAAMHGRIQYPEHADGKVSVPGKSDE